MKQAVFNKTAFIPVEIDMSVLTVSNVTHGFGARQILDDASFRLLKGEHVGLIGANGEGKSTFLNIITGKIPPDEGKIEWSNQVTVGYLDQHAVLEKGMTIRDVLQRAFDDLFVMEQNINDAYNRMGDVSEDEMNKFLEQVGEWQEILEQRGFYEIDAVIERTAAGLGPYGYWARSRCYGAQRWPAYKGFTYKTFTRKTNDFALGRTDKLS